MADDKIAPEPKQTSDGNALPDTSEATAPDTTALPDGTIPKRRQFVTGVITAIGAVGGAALLGSPKGASAEVDATQLRSQIVSRIQEELKRSKADLMNNYDKPDSPTGTHGRYLKGV